MFINYNSKILPANQPIFSNENRAFRYGDGLFETIRMFDGQLPFWPNHWDRLLAGAQYLKFHKLHTSDFYKNEILKLCGTSGNRRIRLSLFRKEGGLYTPTDFETNFLIEASPLKSNLFELNTEGLSIGICDDATILRHPLSNLKTSNGLPYVLAAICKQENQWDDCILLNEAGRVAEASSSNIIIIKNNELLTPPLTSGCKDGTMRKLILQLAREHNFIISEMPIEQIALLKVKEIWLTNAIQGIQWVSRFQENLYGNEMAVKITALLNEKIKS